MHTNTSQKWAQLIFGNANLGDPRRTRRLALLASDMAENAGSSIVKASDTPAKVEAAYRFIRNEKISPQAIADSGFSQTIEAVKQLKN